MPLSADGRILAIGAPSHECRNELDLDSGMVEVFEWDDSDDALDWTRMGSNIKGEPGDKLSVDGKTVAAVVWGVGKVGVGRVFAWG